MARDSMIESIEPKVEATIVIEKIVVEEEAE
jgi:hypothetical protein